MTQESLIEQAARVYDFDAFFRSRPADARTVEPRPVPAPAVAPAPAPADPISKADVMPTLAAIPVEFLANGTDDEDDWTPPPSDIALIDRTMLAEKGMLVPGAPVGALAEEFRDIIGRHFRQPEEGLGYDDSPASHMWRTFIKPDAPL